MTHGADRRVRRSWSDWLGFAFFMVGVAWFVYPLQVINFLLLPVVLKESFTGVTFLLRDRPRAAIGHWAPRAAAYLGSFMIPWYVRLFGLHRAPWGRATDSTEVLALCAILWFGGSLICIWALWHMRRSFSLEPAARALVTSGPYRFARHPIYSAYILMFVALGLTFPSVPYVCLFVTWLAVTLLRIRYEEAVLTRAYPVEYARYQREVGAFAPRLTHPRPAPVAASVPAGAPTGAAPAGDASLAHEDVRSPGA